MRKYSEDDILQDDFWLTVMRISRHWRRIIDHELAEIGLSQAQGWPLLILARSDKELRISAIADVLGVEGPSLVRIIDALAAEGMVSRRPDPCDRRARLLKLTPTGEARIAELLDVMRSTHQRILSQIGEGEQADIISALSRLECLLAASSVRIGD